MRWPSFVWGLGFRMIESRFRGNMIPRFAKTVQYD
jgi:hypothetical protein